MGTRILLILLLIAINAFFAAAEMAIVSLNRNRLRTLAGEGNPQAVKLEALLLEPTGFLSTIQVGITLAGFFSSAAAATGLAGGLGIWLEERGIPWGSQLAFITTTLILSYLVLVLGELYPKRLALQRAERVALFSAGPLLLVQKIARPFVRLLSVSTDALVRISGMNPEGLQERITEEEIRTMVDMGEKQGVLNETERRMIQRIFSFNDTLAEQIMTPRTDVFMLDEQTTVPEAVDALIREGYSRVPVFREKPDRIIGILYAKDLLGVQRAGRMEEIHLEDVLRAPRFVPGKTHIDELFLELQRTREHMALLVDEHGGFAGLVTLEDLVEEIMGDIDDEYDRGIPLLRRSGRDRWILRGDLSLRELREELHLKPDGLLEEYTTLNGMLIHLLGGIPPEDQKATVVYQEVRFEIQQIRDNRIRMVEAKRLNSGNVTDLKEK